MRQNQYCYIILLGILCLSQISFAQFKNRLTIEAGSAYGLENFRWSIAGHTDGTDPNIYSELIYKSVQSVGFYTNVQYALHPKLQVEIGYSKRFGFSGRATDTDYGADDRQDGIVDKLNSDKGKHDAAHAQIDYLFWKKNYFSTLVGAGYASTTDVYYLTDKKSPDLKSTYKATWTGPYARLQVEYHKNVWTLGTDVTYRMMRYKAVANWNKQEEFAHPVSFRHTAKHASGFEWGINAGYQLFPAIHLNLLVQYVTGRSGKGSDMLYLANGSETPTQMNGAFKKGILSACTVKYRF